MEGLIALLVIGIVAVIIMVKCVKSVPQANASVVERLGA